MVNISEAIKKARTKKGLTQKELAERLNKSKNVISNWENGINKPDADMIERLCYILDIPVNDLFPETSKFGNSEIDAIIEELHRRPEMKALFSISKNATKEDIEKTIKIIEALKEGGGNE